MNNAAYFWFGRLEDVTPQIWHKAFNTNVIGYAGNIQAALPYFRKRGKGVVVNMASVSSFIAQPDMFVYNATKGAVTQLTKCLALDLAKDHIRVNAICPGAIWTPASYNHMKYLGLEKEEGKKIFGDSAAMKRIGHPDEVAATAAFLASDDASYITGEAIVVDGGTTLD